MVGSPAADFRKRAANQREAATTLLDGADIATDPKKQIAATVGYVASYLYDALADLVEYQAAVEAGGTLTAQRRAVLERNSAMRRAAAQGNWDEFDRLAGIDDAHAGTGGSGSDGTGAGA